MYVAKMSMNNLSIDGEFRYIVQWFNEWSELQRDDFVPILVEYMIQGSKKDVYMNGMESSVANACINDKPMSLFQCRIKLFRQWSPKWPQEFRLKLKEKIMEIDTKVGEKVINEMKQLQNGNGHTNGLADDVEATSSREDIVTAAVAIVDATATATINAVLLNETSVDDAEVDAQSGNAVELNIELAEQVRLGQPTEERAATIVIPQAVTNNAEVPLVV